ncbi:MAG TPA: hypothetical protein DCW55_04790 [Candidatus Pacebacteria bacterium]|nr:hypothetical protein [Candidatus Paceibacterota bacterium]
MYLIPKCNTMDTRKRLKHFKKTLKKSRAIYWMIHHKKIVALIFVALILGFCFYLFRDLPSPSKLKNASAFAMSTKIFDRNGILLYEIYGDENRTPVPIEELPQHIKQATIAIEDQHFYSHFGFDASGMIRAVRNMIFKQQLQGGSTITQQLVKTALLTRERTVRRKIKEAVLTLGTEMMYTKDEILEMYLNHIPYGGTAWGIEAASQMYFDKHAKDLTLSESAMLAGLPQSPTRYSPFGTNPDLAKARQKDVLRRMYEEEFISEEQMNNAINEELKFAEPKSNILAPHFVMYVKEQLVDAYGELPVERDGLRVYTTLDYELQQASQASLSAELKKLEKMKVGNGSAMITDPRSGEILVMIGSKNYFEATQGGQVNVTLRPRQPGSSIKPINVVTGFQLKTLTPATMLLDIPTSFLVPGQKSYRPRNYDGGYHGPVQTRFFLGNSYNIPQIRAITMHGVESMIATGSAMGISTWTDSSKYGLSLALGGGEVTMADMTVAFGTLSNQGIKVPLHCILRVENNDGSILQQYNPEEMKELVQTMTEDTTIKEQKLTKTTGLSDQAITATRVLDREPAYLISHILLDNSARLGAFGERSELVIPNQAVSVKTGTTNDLRDNWTIGYTPEVLVATWVGNNDSTSMNQSLVSGVTGAAPIWNDLMRYVLRGKKAVWPEKPKDVIDKEICAVSGLLPNPEARCNTRIEFFWKGTEPQENNPADIDHLPREIWITPETGLPPKEGDAPNDHLISEKHLLLSDPLTKDWCADCIRPLNEKGRTIWEEAIVRITPQQMPQVEQLPQAEE